jgi:hypothetical protein
MTLARLAQDRRSVQLIDLADGTEEGRVTAQSRILDVTFSPTGSVLVLTLPNGSIHIWDRARQSERHIRDGNLRSPALSFNAEASLLAAYSREAGALTLWSTANGDLLSREFETVGRADGPPAVPFFSADGRTIYLMPYQAKRKYIQRWRVPGAGPGTGPVGRSGAHPPRRPAGPRPAIRLCGLAGRHHRPAPAASRYMGRDRGCGHRDREGADPAELGWP